MVSGFRVLGFQAYGFRVEGSGFRGFVAIYARLISGSHSCCFLGRGDSFRVEGLEGVGLIWNVGG